MIASFKVMGVLHLSLIYIIDIRQKASPAGPGNEAP